MNVVLASWRSERAMGELLALVRSDAEIDSRDVEQRPEHPAVAVHALAEDDVICSCREHGAPESGPEPG